MRPDVAIRNRQRHKPFGHWVMPIPESGCRVWIGAVNNKGYGVTRYKDKQIYAHRLAWILERGEIPEGKWVLHKCDVPCCTNVDHLFLGDVKDNVHDMMKKGRMVQVRGEDRPGAKLTEKDVLEIHRLLASGETQTRVALKFGVNSGTISAIHRGKKWKHVGLPGNTGGDKEGFSI